MKTIKSNPWKKFTLILITTIITINSISAAIIIENPAPPDPFPRPESKFGEIPIQFGADTEHLGYVDDSQISLYWFIHITDVHINSNENDTNLADFKEFLNFSYYNIAPFTVINTGDMIMGQRPDSIVKISEKVIKEWTNYFSAVNSSPYATDPNPYRYIETPGNHDRNSDWGARAYLNYTLAGRNHGTIQIFFSANFSRGPGAFSMLDSSPWSAPPVILGSEGHLDAMDLDEYHRFLEMNKDSINKFTFFHHPAVEAFGIAPTSLSIMPKTLLQLNRQYGVDICFFGHSHFHFLETYGQSAHMMGDRFKDYAEYAETHLQEKNFYHIISVDNGGINYINVPMDADPQILITNPSNPLFLNQRNQRNSTRGDGNIRALIFTKQNDSIEKVEYMIDSTGEWSSMNRYNGTSARIWESVRSADGVIPNDGKNHKITVKVTMKNGEIFYQYAESTAHRKLQMVWELIFAALIILPLVLSLFVYFIKKNKKTQTNISNKTEAPQIISFLSLALVIFSFVIPVAVVPTFQGGFGGIFGWAGVISTRGIDWFSEGVMYVSLKISLGLLFLALGFRKQNFKYGFALLAQLTIITNAILFVPRFFRAYNGFIFAPGFFIDLCLSVVIIIIIIRESKWFEKIKRIIKNRKI